MSTGAQRDHGGGIDAACARFGGARSDWLDLSTGINPTPYQAPEISQNAWTALPDRAAQDRLIAAARVFWNVPKSLDIIATAGASSPIAHAPRLFEDLGENKVDIPQPTYNEHAAAFQARHWDLQTNSALKVIVQPNNPDGRIWTRKDLDAKAHIIDESFADIDPSLSLLEHTGARDIVLKSFGKFWGLAGLRLGFAIGAPKTIAALSDMLGPWPVSGPALEIGADALENIDWAKRTRLDLAKSAARLDALTAQFNIKTIGGTSLFRLVQVADAHALHERLARQQIWTRVFPYSQHWMRLGLPPASQWERLTRALEHAA